MPPEVRNAPVRGGILAGLLLFLAAGCALAALAWMLLLPVVVTAQVRSRTGFDATFSSLMVNPFTGHVVAKGFVLANPPTFPRREFLQVREFEIDGDLLTLFSDKPVIRRLRLDIALVALVKRADGRTNTQVFQNYLAGSPANSSYPRVADPIAPAPSTANPAAYSNSAAQPAPAKRHPFLIRELQIKVDRFLISDHTGRDPVVHDYALQLDRTFANVTDAQQLLLPASLDQLFALSGAVGSILPADLTGAIDRAMRSGTDVMRELARQRPTIFQGFTDTLEESRKP
jgi:uncharacterized protein involved in outer membrane biogenesis